MPGSLRRIWVKSKKKKKKWVRWRVNKTNTLGQSVMMLSLLLLYGEKITPSFYLLLHLYPLLHFCLSYKHVVTPRTISHVASPVSTSKSYCHTTICHTTVCHTTVTPQAVVTHTCRQSKSVPPVSLGGPGELALNFRASCHLLSSACLWGFVVNGSARNILFSFHSE